MKDYHINIFHSEDHHAYVGDIPDLEGCIALGNTPAEALSEVESARDRWLKAAGAEGRPVPEPHYRPEIYFSKDLVIPSVVTETQAAEPQPSYKDVLEYIAKRVAKRECILFLGSAIHVSPPDGLTQYSYPPEKAPPIGINLSKYLADKCKYPGQDWWNLQRVAQHFESTTKSRFRLVEEIKDAVHVGREPSPMLRMLADLQFPLVITTNYDQLYEQSLDLRAAEMGLSPGLYDVSIYSANNLGQERLETLDCAMNPDPQRPFILKIHGDVSRPESIVITDEDYIQFVLRMSDTKPFHPFGQNVLAYLMKWPILFIGYSLMDYNLRLLFKTLRWRKDAAQIPPTYSVDKKPDQLIRDVWENQRRYVSFIVLNLWDFIPNLHALVNPPASGPAEKVIIP